MSNTALHITADDMQSLVADAVREALEGSSIQPMRVYTAEEAGGLLGFARWQTIYEITRRAALLARRWPRDYRAVPPRWRFVPASLSASATLPGAISLSAGPSLTRGAWTLSAGYSAFVWQGETMHGVSVGVRWEPLRWEW